MQNLLEDQTRTLRAAVGKVTGAEVDDASEVVATPKPATRDSPDLQPQAPVALGKETQDHLAALNPEQRRAVEYGIGPDKLDQAWTLNAEVPLMKSIKQIKRPLISS